MAYAANISQSDRMAVVHGQSITDEERFDNKRGCWAWFSTYVLFGYFSPFMQLAAFQGSSSVLPENLPNLWPSDKLSIWTKMFRTTSSAEGNSRFRLLKTLLTMFWPQFILMMIARLSYSVLKLLSVQLMSWYLHWQETGSSDFNERKNGILSGVGILLLQLCCIIYKVQMTFWTQRVNIRLKAVLTTGLFQQILLPSHTRQHSNVPQASAYTILCVDVPGILGLVDNILDLIILPFDIGIIFKVLRGKVGFSAYVGLATLLVIIIIIFVTEIRRAKLRGPYLKHRDERVNRCHDILCSIRTLRSIGWEDIGVDHIMQSRDKEMQFLKSRVRLSAIATYLSRCAYVITKLTILITYVMWSVESDSTFVLKASIAYFVTHIIGHLVEPLTSFPFLVNSMLEGWVSMERYQSYVFASNSLPVRNPSSVKFSHSSIIDRISSTASFPVGQTVSTSVGFLSPRASRTFESAVLLPDDNLSIEDDEVQTSFSSDSSSRPPSSRCARQTDTTLRPVSSAAEDFKPSSVLCVHIENATYTWMMSSVCEDDGNVSFPVSFEMMPPTSFERLEMSDAATSWRGETAATPLLDGTAFVSHVTPALSNNTLAKHSFRVEIPNLRVSRGECVTITGSQGSGRSSALQALLGEMRKVRGYHHVSRSSVLNKRNHLSSSSSSVYTDIEGAIGFSSQIPWIPEGTIRSAILFGRAYDPVKYETVLEVCQLCPDLECLAKGDLTTVAEGAATLSGGQKSRISLARAVYDYPVGEGKTGCKVFLLDDPFVSVDPNVGLAIFSNLFGKKGIMKHAAVILTIDECSLCQFLSSIKPSELCVNLTSRWICNGVLLEPDRDLLQEANHLRSPKSPARNNAMQTPTSTLILDSPRTNLSPVESFEHTGYDTFAEAVEMSESLYSGVVAKDSYVWYSLHVGTGILITMTAMVFLMNCGSMTSEFWLAHWTSSASPVEHTTVHTETMINNSSGLAHYRAHDFTPAATVLTEAAYTGIVKKVDNHFSWMQERREYADPPDFVIQSSAAPSQNSSIHRDVENLASDNQMALKVFTVLSGIYIVTLGAYSVSGYYGILRSAKRIHDSLLQSVISAPLWLHDFMSLGTLINRFSQDVSRIDDGPLYSIGAYAFNVSYVIAVTVALGLIAPWCVPLIPIVAWLIYSVVFQTYRHAAREFQRALLASASPLCGNISEAESGAAVIRAFGAQSFYRERNEHLTNNSLKVSFMQVGAACWAGARLKLLGYPFTVINTVVPSILTLIGVPLRIGFVEQFIGLGHPHRAGFVALAVAMALELPKSLNHIVWGHTDLELKMCSVERLKEVICGVQHQILRDNPISNNQAEISVISKISSIDQLPKERSGVCFTDLTVSYDQLVEFQSRGGASGASILTCDRDRFARKSLPPCIFKLSARAGPNEHIGVVGRTGAGKTTFLMSLLNLVPAPVGAVRIDDIPISSIDRNVLHEIVGIVPQGPIVFKGWTLRRFLDPRNEFSTEDLLAAVEKVNLLKTLNSLPGALDTILNPSEDGADRPSLPAANNKDSHSVSINRRIFSDSQLRILSIARLSLYADRLRVVIVDEPPASQRIIKSSSPPSSPRKEHQEWFKSPATPNNLLEEEIEAAYLIKKIFPFATVFVVAHHASTLKHTQSIWVLSRGKLVNTVKTASLKTQDDLMQLLSRC